MWNELPGDKFEEEFSRLIQRRSQHEPLQYILGSWSFLDFSVKTSSGALIPRPETEEVFLAAVRQIEAMKLPEDFVFADVCTGTGVLGIAMARTFPQAIGWLSDISPEALKVATENLKFSDADLSDRINLVRADLLEAFLPESMNVIVANPPYVNSGDMSGLMPEVKEFEPALALDGGVNGLDFIEKLLFQASLCLKSNGLLVFEHGHGQRSDIYALLAEHDEFKVLCAGDDLCGRERYFILQLSK